MKKILLTIFTVMLAFAFLGCPTEVENNNNGGKKPVPRPDSPSDPLKAPRVLADGAYVYGTRITMDAMGMNETLLYTFDGSDPDLSNPSAKTFDPNNLPRMTGFKNGALTVKVQSYKTGRAPSIVVTRNYTEIVFGANAKMQAMRDAMQAADGTSIADPFWIVLDDTWKMTDVAKIWKDTENPSRELFDGLFYIFDSMLANQYYGLDMSQITTKANWLGYNDEDQEVFAVLGCSNDSVLAARPNRGRLAQIKFPPAVEYIGASAFQSCGSLWKVQLKDLSKLKSIGANAFQSVSMQELDLSGCSSLRELKNNAFRNGLAWSGTRPIDLSETALASLGERVFNGAGFRASCIEFPITFREVGSYQWGGVSNILYIRHRSLVAPDYGWDQYNYHNSGSTHMYEGIDNEYSPKGDHTFPIYVPNVVTMRKSHGSFWMADDDGYRWASQSVPLGKPVTSANWTPASDPDFHDSLREMDLINAQELYRGVATLDIKASGLTGVDGQTVTVTINGISTSQTATISGGAFNLSIGTPDPSFLKEMNPFNFQEVTIPYSDVRNKNAQSLTGSDIWGISTTRSGVYGLPHIGSTPENGRNPAITTYEQFYDPANSALWHTNAAKYAVLTLTLPGNKEVLNQTSDVREVQGNGTSVYSEQRTVTYVYVDTKRFVHRMARASQSRNHYLASVIMELKPGWNFVETRTTTNSSAGGPAPDFLPTDPGNTSIWISGGIIADNPASVLNASTQFRIDSKPIGWVVK